MSSDVMLSLVSNPHNPFNEYDLWLNFDHKEGFDTAGLLARSISTSSSLSEFEQEQDIEDAIDSIINNPSFAGLYQKIRRS
jgi:hypothetical protein